MADEVILSIRNVNKRFGGTQALKNVSFDIHPGEIHALMGENGAGKSTLVKIISSVISKDSGSIIFKGKELSSRSPQEARTAGINIVYQELSLSPYLSVGENISASSMPMDNFRLMDPNRISQDASDLLKISGISPKTIVKDLGMGAQQIVEISGAVSRNCSLLILDEPTSSLTTKECDELFRLVRLLQKSGVTIIYISHKIGEVFQIADKITVLKDGEYMGTRLRKETNEEDIIQMMVGRNLQDMYPSRSNTEKEKLLDVENLSGTGFTNISFTVYRGEILGFAGLAGAGRSELFTAIFGANNITSGSIFLEGKKVEFRDPSDAMQHGIGYLSEDRKGTGLFLEMAVKDNTVIASLDDHSGRLFVKVKQIRDVTLSMVERLRIKIGTIDSKIFSLSGGNQQKVLLARWLLVRPKVLIVDEPTRGIDVGAKQEVYAILRELANSGIAIVMISSEIPEILGMSDRIVAMYHGKLMTLLENDQRTEEFLAPAIVGIPRKNGKNER